MVLDLVRIHLSPYSGSGHILLRSGTKYPLRSLFHGAESATLPPAVAPRFEPLILYGRPLTTSFRLQGSSGWP